MNVLKRALLVAIIALSPPAWANAPRVVVISKSADHPLVVQLEDELTALGVELVPVVSSSSDDPELAALADKYGAAAAVNVDYDSNKIVILAEVAGSQEAGSRREVTVAPSPGAAVEPNLLALRTVELLRGFLLPVDRAKGAPSVEGTDGPSPSEDSTPPVAPVVAHEVQPKSRARTRTEPPAAVEAAQPLSLLLAPAAAWSPGGVAPALGLRLAAEYRFVRWLGVEPSALLPAGAAQADAPGGALDVRVLLVGGALRASAPLGKWLSLGAGAGAAGLWTRWERTGGSVRTSDVQDEAWSAVPYVEANGTFWLHSVVGLRADALVGFSLPGVEMKVSESPAAVDVPVTTERTSATFGRPMLLLSLGFEVRL